MKINNIETVIDLELDAFENMSVSVGCRLGLANTFCCSPFFFKYNKKLIVTLYPLLLCIYQNHRLSCKNCLVVSKQQ